MYTVKLNIESPQLILSMMYLNSCLTIESYTSVNIKMETTFNIWVLFHLSDLRLLGLIA